jgi:hypothetical protein
VATIGPVDLKIKLKGEEAAVEVGYEIAFDSFDQHSNQAYVEVCRLIGDDTATGDLPGPDTTIGFLTPLFVTNTAAEGKPALKRDWKKTFRKSDLDEDRGPNVDELRAQVTLTPVAPAAAKAESNLVTKKI